MTTLDYDDDIFCTDKEFETLCDEFYGLSVDLTQMTPEYEAAMEEVSRHEHLQRLIIRIGNYKNTIDACWTRACALPHTPPPYAFYDSL
jgi:hypothetical protein